MATQVQTAPRDADVGNVESAGASPMHCPDPSAHKTKDSALQNQASAAALYSTKSIPRNPLGTDGRLSSASAATSLKHAQVQDLPGFPVVGIDTRTSANAAAHLASTNTKSPEWWKPEQSAAAGKAALLANDYKMKPLWQPEASAAGSKAALLAHKDKDNAKVHLWTPGPNSYGNSAATIAMGKKGASPQAASSSVNGSNSKALLAATGAVSNSGRKRAQSSPAPTELYPDASNSARNALSAATIATSPSMRASKTNPTPTLARITSPAMEAARIQHARISKEMYTERPPVAIEVEEKKRQDALKASAISMAKKLYDVQQHHIETATGTTPRSHAQTGATAAHGQQPGSSEADLKAQAMQYIGVQEAAQRLAAERLAKIEPDDSSNYRNYYGYEKPTRSKLSIRRGRPRAVSNPETVDSDDDELTPRRIRNQMSQLNRSIAEVDAKKREQDRKQLLAAAERKVHAQMLGLDKKIYDETGKMSPAMIDEWDAKARAKAAANSEARMEHHGKVHLGSGKYMDQADIEAVALARIQPTLNDIAEKTEKRRAEEEEQRLEMEEKKREAQIEKERNAEIKAEEKRAREEEKRAQRAREAEEKAAAKQEKEAKREKEAEEKRMAKEEKRKSREAPKPAAVNTAGTTTGGDITVQAIEGTPPGSPTTPKPGSKGIKSFLNKLKRKSKPPPGSAEAEKQGFVGGAALHNSDSGQGPTAASPSGDNSQVPPRRGSDASSVTSDERGQIPERTVSGVSEISEISRVTPQRTPTGQSGGGYSDVSEIEEARDDFNEELAPPPVFTTSDARAARIGSPTRDSKFHEVGI